MRTAFIALALAVAAPLAAQVPTAPAAAVSKYGPVTVEYYYRIKWGQHAEFKRLYKKITSRS